MLPKLLDSWQGGPPTPPNTLNLADVCHLVSIFDGFFLLATFKPVSGGIIYDVRYSGTSTQPPVIVKMMIIRRSSMTTMTRSMLSYLTKRQREKQRRARATAPPTWKV